MLAKSTNGKDKIQVWLKSALLSLLLLIPFDAEAQQRSNSSALDDLLRGLRETQPDTTTEQEPTPPRPGTPPEFIRETTPTTRSAERRPADRTTIETDSNPYLMSELNRILSGMAPDAVRVHLTFPGAGNLSQEQVTQSAAIVQGLGLRTDLKPLFITHGSQLIPGRFNVLVGTFREIGEILGSDLERRMGNSGIALIPLPGYPDEPMLVVAGEDSRRINEAILALGFTNIQLPRANFVSISRVLFPDVAPYFGQPPVMPGRTYSFLELRQSNAPIRPVTTGGIGIQVYFPADIFSRPNAEVSISIHFMAGQRTIRSSDAMIIRLNGSDIARRPWAEAQPSDQGGRLVNLSVPIANFLPGRNLLEITTDSRTHSSFALDATGAVAQDFDIYEDSTIEIPSVPRLARLPDLRLTTRTFYPFIGQPDGSEISFLLTDNRTETVNAALMAIAKLSQMSNTFMYNADVSFTFANPDRHLVVVGPQARIPRTLRERIPSESFSEIGSSDRDTELSDETRPPPNLFQRMGSAIANEFVKIQVDQPDDSVEPGAAQQTPSAIGPRAVLTSFPSPENVNRWVLVFTAANDDLLSERMRQLIRHSYWSQVRGYLFSWNDTPTSIRFFLPERRFSEVSFSETIVGIPPFGIGVSLRIWYIFAAIVFVIFCLATLALLKTTDKTAGKRREHDS